MHPRLWKKSAMLLTPTHGTSSHHCLRWSIVNSFPCQKKRRHQSTFVDNVATMIEIKFGDSETSLILHFIKEERVAKSHTGSSKTAQYRDGILGEVGYSHWGTKGKESKRKRKTRILMIISTLMMPLMLYWVLCNTVHKPRTIILPRWYSMLDRGRDILAGRWRRNWGNAFPNLWQVSDLNNPRAVVIRQQPIFRVYQRNRLHPPPDPRHYWVSRHKCP